MHKEQLRGDKTKVPDIGSISGFILPLLQREIALAMLQVRDRTWFVRLYGDNPQALTSGLSTVQTHKLCSISLVP